MSTGSELITKVRDIIRDKATPYRCSDSLVLGYLADGITALCRQTHYLVDTTEYISTSDGVPTYKEKERILKVYAARIQGENTLLYPERGASAKLHVSATTGQPTSFSTNIGRRQITFWPVPDDTYIIEQICAVKPDTRIEKDTDSLVEEDHEIGVVNYAAAQCLLVNDIDGINPGAGAELFALWRNFIIDMKQEIYRYRTTEQLVIEHWAGV